MIIYYLIVGFFIGLGAQLSSITLNETRRAAIYITTTLRTNPEDYKADGFPVPIIIQWKARIKEYFNTMITKVKALFKRRVLK